MKMKLFLSLSFLVSVFFTQSCVTSKEAIKAYQDNVENDLRKKPLGFSITDMRHSASPEFVQATVYFRNNTDSPIENVFGYVSPLDDQGDKLGRGAIGHSGWLKPGQQATIKNIYIKRNNFSFNCNYEAELSIAWNSYIGLGYTSESTGGGEKIVGIHKGGPLDKSGEINVGDLITEVAIGENEFQNINNTQSVEHYNKSVGTIVRLKVKPHDNLTEIKEVKLAYGLVPSGNNKKLNIFSKFRNID